MISQQSDAQQLSQFRLIVQQHVQSTQRCKQLVLIMQPPFQSTLMAHHVKQALLMAKSLLMEHHATLAHTVQALLMMAESLPMAHHTVQALLMIAK